ncbi:hypothetical protein LMH87_005287 [Akanthomyces muscarius]|uniref:Uncharacterized protein n=1 Tax=Akanthomyces muscarius TaxID=2231603 RepID=A0A9W8QMZ4_AKAMU|nr:hypothetical protein LMH87_005287 [Akanthomyces muscarius]KAJ4163566.1 hypothetical protein LMH87_005287 [Akanthomyces muscarius]
MADAYFCRASSAFEGYCITQAQIDTLRAYIDGTSTTEEAVSLLVSYPEASPSPVEMKQRLGGLWTLLNDTAVNLEFSQPQVINILKHIRTLPGRPEPKGEGEGFIDLDDGFYWRELTDWGINWADAFNSYSAQLFNAACPTQEERRARERRWNSACRYSARLASTGDATLSLGASLDLATTAISEGLETDLTEQGSGCLDTAAQVFEHASGELWRRCKEKQAEGVLSSSNGLWRGQAGYSIDRWQFWKDRWNSLAEQQAISPNIRDLAKEALAHMDMVED